MRHLERAFDGQNQIWKYIVVLLVGFIAANFIGALPLLIVIAVQNMRGYSANPENIMDLSAYGLDLNIGLILMLLPFLIGLIVLIPLIKSLHKRSFSEVINGTKKIRWNRFFFSMGIWTLLLIINWVIEYIAFPQDFILQFDPVKFIILFIISIILIPFQTTFEEIIFRGYLMQGIGFWTKNRWMAIIIPAVAFGLMHSFNPEVESFGFLLAMPQYITFGLLFGIMTVLDDGIETTMGTHAANNIFLCLFITSKDSALQTYAIFQQINVKTSIMDTVELLIAGVILILILKYKYKWKFSVLNKKIESETSK